MFRTFSGNWKIGKALNLARAEFGVDVDRLTGLVSRPSDPAAMALRAEARRMCDDLGLNDKELASMLVLPFAGRFSSGTKAVVRERLLFWLNLGVVRQEAVQPLLDEVE